MRNSVKIPKQPGQLISKMNSQKLGSSKLQGFPKLGGLSTRGGVLLKKHKGTKKKNWIAGAIKHPGALHRQLGVKAGNKIPAKTLARAANKGGKLGRRARLAQTLKHLNH
jgi:hypothetical protein